MNSYLMIITIKPHYHDRSIQKVHIDYIDTLLKVYGFFAVMHFPFLYRNKYLSVRIMDKA